MAQNTPKPKSNLNKPGPRGPKKQKKQSVKSTANRTSKANNNKKSGSLLKQKAGSNMTTNLEKMLADRAGYTEIVSKGTGRQRRGTGISKGAKGAKKK